MRKIVVPVLLSLLVTVSLRADRVPRPIRPAADVEVVEYAHATRLAPTVRGDEQDVLPSRQTTSPMSQTQGVHIPVVVWLLIVGSIVLLILRGGGE